MPARGSFASAGRATGIMIKVFLFSVILFALVLPGMALWHLASEMAVWLVAGYAFLISLAGFIACLRDKRKAQRGEWRIPEATLHLIELAGGWPGSFAAQRRFRHKTAKPGYQVMFWLIVSLHQLVALDYLREWVLLGRVMQAVHS